jgi:four helix bundle protein
MGRLRKDLIDRTDSFADRVLDVVNAIKHRSCPAFVRDQLGRSGSSVGSNACEADEAATVPEFRHCLGVSLRELSETKFWLRMTARRGWVDPKRLQSLLDEAQQLTRIIFTILSKSDPARRPIADDDSDGPPRPTPIRATRTRS